MAGLLFRLIIYLGPQHHNFDRKNSPSQGEIYIQFLKLQNHHSLAKASLLLKNVKVTT